MIVKAYRTAKFKTVEEIKCKRVVCASDDPATAKECADNEWTPLLGCVMEDGTTQFYPVYFVIEIKEEEK